MIEIFSYFLLFMFGGALGSFAGVIVDRLYIKSFITGRSNCDTCNRELDWFELIPMFSYLFLRGRCRKCKTRIGSEKFWIELSGGILISIFSKIYLAKYFIGAITYSGILNASLLLLLFGFLFVIFSVIFIYDLRHKLVPTGFSLLLIVTGLAFEGYRVFNTLAIYGSINTSFWLDLFSGFLIALPFYLIYIFSKKKGVGFGDIVIFFGVGYLAGFISGLTIFFISIWLGAIVSIALMVIYPKRFNRKSQIPFAPFILLATILVIILQINLLSFFQFL